MAISDLLKLVWSLASSRIGILVLAGLSLGGFGLYHKVTTWRSNVKIATITQEKDNALRDLREEKQKVADLQATIKFQRDQLALRQRVQKESTDVKEAVDRNDLNFIRDNYRRLHDYKNPTAIPKNPGSIRKRTKPSAKVGALH